MIGGPLFPNQPGSDDTPKLPQPCQPCPLVKSRVLVLEKRVHQRVWEMLMRFKEQKPKNQKIKHGGVAGNRTQNLFQSLQIVGPA